MKCTIPMNNFLPKSFNIPINDFNLTFPENKMFMKNQIKNQNFELINNKENVKNYLNIPSESHQILLGSLLGDMYLRRECKNSNIEETHSIRQKEYLEWKYKILSTSFDLKLYNFNNPLCKARGRTYNRKTEVRLRSKVSKELNLYHDLFYKNGVKRVSLSLLNQLEPLALAVWYCDDGYYDPENHTAEIHTEGFSIEENQIIKKWFSERWNINVNFKKDPSKNKVLLRFPVKETNKFFKIIINYIFKMPKSIWYKLGHFWEGNKEIIDKSRLNKIKRNKIYRLKPEVRIKGRQHAKKYYYKNRVEILQKKAEYLKTKKYKDYLEEYLQRPEVKKRISERRKIYGQKPEYKRKRLIYQKEYRKRPEVRIKIKEYNRRAREKQRRGDIN